MEENTKQQTPEQLLQQPVQPVINQATQSSPTAKSRSPLILIVIFILLIILGFSAYYYLGVKGSKSITQMNPDSPSLSDTWKNSPSPTIDETANPDSIGANWKTLTSNICHLSLQYPGNWNGEVVEGEGCAFKIKDPNIKTNYFLLNTVASYVTWSSIVNQNKEGQTTLIAGKEGLMTKPLIDDTAGIYGGYFHTNDFIYTMVYFIGNENADAEDIYKRIISSIKFTDQNQTADTSNWKTYSSPLEKISFKYPLDWILLSDEGGDYITDSAKKVNLRTTGDLKGNSGSIKQDLHNYLETGTSYGNQDLVYLSEKEIIINEKKGWYAYIKIGKLNQEDLIFFVEDKFSSDRYTGLWLANIKSEHQLIFDQILSTFKSTN